MVKLFTHKLELDTQPYPGDSCFSSQRHLNTKEHGCTVTNLAMSSHSGTHIDAPYHFFDEGKTVDELDLSALVGPAAIVDLTSKEVRERITWDDLVQAGVPSLLIDRRILLIRTGWSRYWKTQAYHDHPFLDKGAADKLVELGMRVLGVDTFSPDETVVDGSGFDFGVHGSVLGAGGMIVENLTGLEQLPSARIHVSLLPLNIAGCDGSPIRAVAWIPESQAAD